MDIFKRKIAEFGDLKRESHCFYTVFVFSIQNKHLPLAGFHLSRSFTKKSGASFNISFAWCDLVKLVIALETEFEFDDDKLLISEFPTVLSLVEYVE